jgi:predicted small lipoprotein YifL
MRGRILMAILTATLGLTACGKRDSLYIDPGKADAPAKHPRAKPPPPRPAPPTP